MKKLLIISIFSLFVLAGCTSDDMIVDSPQNTPDQKIEWLAAPNNFLRSETELTISETVNGNTGSKILVNETLGKIELNGSLTILKGSFQGRENISVTFNEETFFQDYRPSPFVFKIPLILNLIYKNVNLDGTDPSTVGFYFLSDSGVFYKAQYDSLIVNPSTNTLGVIGARIPHFSRWGWAKSIE